MREGLRAFLHDLCLFRGADIASGTFPDQIGYVKSVSQINMDQLIRFTILNNDWYEKLGEPNYDTPKKEELKNVIKEIRLFIDLK